ncbi:uncharacterized protein LODBEIA_P08790 [Lodderomyces beijingensis]|uniref:Exoribonuclease phosphorolytic domain-containing protein n=1 Tax=Lodderomyces beijingensis TaxID=1775926 RepID=A0ABP0ZER2_9ASCO
MSDRRRITGPVNRIIPTIPTPPTKISPSPPKSSSSSSSPPQFYLKTNLIQNSNGSAYIEIEGTIIQVSIFGPRPIRGSFTERASLSVETKFLPHINQPCSINFNNSEASSSSSNMTQIEHRLSSYLENCMLPSILLEKYPKSTIDIQVSVIAMDPRRVHGQSGLLWLMSWIVVCASMAVVDTGIEVRDIVSSGCVKLVQSSGKVVVGGDVDREEDEESESAGTTALVSFMNMNNNEIVGVWMESDSSQEMSESEMALLIDECCRMSTLVRANLNSYLINSYAS